MSGPRAQFAPPPMQGSHTCFRFQDDISAADISCLLGRQWGSKPKRGIQHASSMFCPPVAVGNPRWEARRPSGLAKDSTGKDSGKHTPHRRRADSGRGKRRDFAKRTQMQRRAASGNRAGGMQIHEERSCCREIILFIWFGVWQFHAVCIISEGAI